MSMQEDNYVDEKSILKAAWPELAQELESEEAPQGEGGQKAEGETDREAATRSEASAEATEDVQGGEGEEGRSAEGEEAEAEAGGLSGEELATLDDIIQKDDRLRAEWEAKVAELEEQGRRKAQSELQPRIDRANEHLATVRATVTKAVEWIGAIAGALNKAAEAGTLDGPTLNQVLASNPDAFKAFTAVSGAHGFYHAMRGVAASFARDVGSDDFARAWVQRWTDIETGAEGDPAKASPAAFAEMVKARDEAMRKSIEEPLRKKIAALEVQLEKAKLAARRAGGPDLASKESASAPLTAEAIEAMSDEEYARRRPEIHRWLATQLTGR